MSLVNLYGPIIFLVGMGAMFLLVPWRRIKKLFTAGLVGGIVVGVVLVYLMQNMLGFWLYPGPADLLHVGGLPVFLILSWFPFIVVFAHLLSQYRGPLLVGLLIFAFPAGAVLMHALMLNDGVLFYNNWSLLATFILSVAIHAAIAFSLYALWRLESRAKTTS